MNREKLLHAMLCGVLGCFCFGGGDWLMLYGDPAYSGSLFWLTEGVAEIPAWRNTLAMALAFPGIVFYGIALFALAALIKKEADKKRYQALTAFGLTPWLALHLFYIMILYLFSWMSGNGYVDSASAVCEALYRHLSWIVLVSEALMLPPFLYWFWLVVRGKTALPKALALVNPLAFYLALYLVKCALPDSAFRIGFTNGLMSESMILCFWFWGVWIFRRYREAKA